MTDTLSIVPLADLKAHLNVTTTDDDAVLTAMLEAARGFAEGWVGPLDNFESVPAGVVHALKLYTAHLYENREATTFSGTGAEVPLGFFDLINPHRKWAFSDADE